MRISLVRTYFFPAGGAGICVPALAANSSKSAGFLRLATTHRNRQRFNSPMSTDPSAGFTGADCFNGRSATVGGPGIFAASAGVSGGSVSEDVSSLSQPHNSATPTLATTMQTVRNVAFHVGLEALDLMPTT